MRKQKHPVTRTSHNINRWKGIKSHLGHRARQESKQPTLRAAFITKTLHGEESTTKPELPLQNYVLFAHVSLRGTFHIEQCHRGIRIICRCVLQNCMLFVMCFIVGRVLSCNCVYQLRRNTTVREENMPLSQTMENIPEVEKFTDRP